MEVIGRVGGIDLVAQITRRPRFGKEIQTKLLHCGWNWRRAEVIAGFWCSWSRKLTKEGRVKKNWQKEVLCPQVIYIHFLILTGHHNTSGTSCLERSCEILGVLGPEARLKFVAQRAVASVITLGIKWIAGAFSISGSEVCILALRNQGWCQLGQSGVPSFREVQRSLSASETRHLSPSESTRRAPHWGWVLKGERHK